jgi:chromosomal replication initiation ATPase DnaA
MEQLALSITHRRVYGASNFVLHAGVSNLFDELSLFYQKTLGFRLATVIAPSRSGLTHLSIALVDKLTSINLFPRLVEGAEAYGWINTRIQSLRSEQSIEHGEVVLIDDAQAYFQAISTDESGHFVNFVESYRRAGAGIILLSHKSIAQIGCDEHVMSRVRSGQQYEIVHPSEQDMPHIIKQMAMQRGLDLSKRELEFLHKRLPRDIPSVDNYFDRAEMLAQVSGRAIGIQLFGDAF